MIFLYQNKLAHYRIDLLEVLNAKISFTLLLKEAPDQDLVNGLTFPVQVLNSWKFGGFTYLIMPRIGSKDLLIAEADITILNWLLVRKSRIIFWGFWRTNSSIANLFRLWLMSRAKANMFYAKSHLDWAVSKGISESRCVHVNNTIVVEPILRNRDTFPGLNDQFSRLNLIFIGTLNKRKGLDKVILVLANVEFSNWHFNILGDGPEQDSLKALVMSLKLSDKVSFVGRVNEIERQREYFKNSHFSISYHQAGLSVLTSLAYGVPVIVHEDAISGGEIENVINYRNGFRVRGDEELYYLLHFLYNNSCIYRRMSSNAISHYVNSCNPEDFALKVSSIV